MIFDVMIRIGFNDKGKQIINVSRIHDASLSVYLRTIQDRGGYIVSVIPLFRQKREQEGYYSKVGLGEEKMREVGEQTDIKYD